MDKQKGGGILWVLSALWWIADGLWKDDFFKWARPMLPDWVIHPPVWSILREISSQGPPIILLIAGTFLIFRNTEIIRSLGRFWTRKGRMILWAGLIVGTLVAVACGAGLWFARPINVAKIDEIPTSPPTAAPQVPIIHSAPNSSTAQALPPASSNTSVEHPKSTTPAPAQTARDPDSIFQLGAKVGTVVAPIVDLSTSTITFAQIENAANLDISKEFEYRDYILKLKRQPPIDKKLMIGGTLVRSLYKVEAEVIGRRSDK